MRPLPDDLAALAPQDLSHDDSRAYVSRTIEAPRHALIGNGDGLVMIDEIEAIGDRPDTRVIFRYHHRREFIDRDPALVAGPLAEAASLWSFAIDERTHGTTGSWIPLESSRPRSAVRLTPPNWSSSTR
jgi:hypothetical protein